MFVIMICHTVFIITFTIDLLFAMHPQSTLRGHNRNNFYIYIYIYIYINCLGDFIKFIILVHLGIKMNWLDLI